MSRLFIIVIISVFSIQLLAFQYKIQSSDYYPAIDINEVTHILSSHELIEFDLKKKGNFFLGQMDQIYFNLSHLDQFAILKLDLVPNASEKIFKLSNNEFVCHSKTSRNRAFSLYVIGKSYDNFLKICNSFSSERKKILQSNLLLRLFFSEVHAGENCSLWQNLVGSVTELKNNLNNSLMMQRLGTCISESARGAGGVFTGFKDNFASLLTTSPQNLWSELSLQAKNILDFVTHLKNELVELKNNFSDLDNELLISLVCHVGGEFLSSTALFALPGYGAIKLSSTIGSALMRLKGTKSLIHRLNDLRKEGKGHIAREVLNCTA